MDPTKKRGRSKIFTCFKPVVDGDDDQLLDFDLASTTSSGDESDGRRKKRIRRSLSVALKTVLFKKPSQKKSRRDSSKEDLDRPNGDLLSKGKKLVKSMKKNLSMKNNSSCKTLSKPEQIFRNNSDRSSLFSSNSSRRTSSSMSSSSASSLSSNSRAESDMMKCSLSLDFRQLSPTNYGQKSMKRSECSRKCIEYNPILDMFYFLVCLVALVFWGKVFAVVACTSMCLFFPPGHCHQRFQKAANRPVNDIMVDSEGYKKRVIMDGLLERNRSRVIQL